MQEIERKFLLTSLPDLSDVESHFICQTYIGRSDRGVVRIRIRDDRGFLTIKSRTVGISRSEFEYEIPVEDARTMMSTLSITPPIEKRRYLIPHGSHLWELDLFEGENSPLAIAEIELKAEDEPFDCPPWVGGEVTHDHRYSNSNLALYPYSTWEK